MSSRVRGRVRVIALAAVPLAAAAAVGAVRYAADPAAPATAARALPVATASPVQAEPGGHGDWTTTAPSPPATPSSSPSAARPTSKAASKTTPKAAPKTTSKAARPLPAAQLPDAHRSGWKEIGPPRTRQTTQDVGVSECGWVHGAVGWRQQGYVGRTKTPAIQDTFTFDSATAADAAYRKLVTAFDGCQDDLRAMQAQHDTPRDAVVTKTASTTGGTAYARSWTAVAGISMPGRQTNHYYVVRRGAALTVVQYTEPGDTPAADPAHQRSDDRAELSVIAAHM
ncbi:hypothetical protein C3492_11645 [Streptomyces sp. Ru62]|uniref:hypothetical protein n=1 Tax=Streptomyces sp. Ru62 TaxID=2080745 RepID=UPI000CDD6690|nr:hypothetical protein [Streptomyces sp. Ru62]POX63313.1 hypothetical protein C3492_11645 [Streptomyces sp. Ru62]